MLPLSPLDLSRFFTFESDTDNYREELDQISSFIFLSQLSKCQLLAILVSFGVSFSVRICTDLLFTNIALHVKKFSTSRQF